HHQINRLSADLQSPASPCDTEWCRCAPAVWGLACGHAFAVITAKSNGDLHHGRDHRNTLGVSHHLVWNCFLFYRHNFVQDVGRVLNSLFNVGLVLVCGPADAPEKEQSSAEGQKKSHDCPGFSSHRVTSLWFQSLDQYTIDQYTIPSKPSRAGTLWQIQ